MKKTVLGLLFVLAQMPVYAKGLAPVATTTATGFNVKFASNGTPLVATQNGSVVAVTGTVNAALGYGKYLPIVAAGAIDGAKMRGPWGAAIGALGSVALIAIPLLADSYLRAGLRVKPDGSIESQDSSVCTVSPCTGYYGPPGIDPNVYGSKTEACNALGRIRTTAPVRPDGGSFRIKSGDPAYCEIEVLPTGATNWVYDANFQYQAVSVPPQNAVYAPITQVDAVSKLTASAPTIGEVQALIDLNFPPEPTMVSLAGPATMPLFNTVQLGTDGSSVTTTETATMSYFPDSVRVARERAQTTTKAPVVTNTLTTNPDGTTTTSVTTTPGTTVTTTQNVAPAPQAEPEAEAKPTITCGLPDTPACKIDETGAPTVSVLNENKAKDAYDPIRDLVADPTNKLPKFPVINWAFQLPSGCALIPMTAFEPFIKPIDVCQFKPMFHELMTIVWIIGGLFGAISMFFKSALAD